MRLNYICVSVIILLGMSCGKNEKSQQKEKLQQEINSEAIAKADSLQRLAAMHRGFIGNHQHALSLKFHAHQNPGKKVRVFRKQKELAPIKRSGAKRANEEREKRIKKILEQQNK